MRQITLTARQWHQLQNSFLLRLAGVHGEHCILAENLLSDDHCRKILHHISPIINSPDLAVTASLLSKRLAFLLTGNCFYAMSVFNKGLNLSLKNCYVEYAYINNRWISSLPVKHIQLYPHPCGRRENWREQITHAVFAKFLAPLWHTFSAVSDIAPQILWENTAVRIYSLYEQRMKDIPAIAANRCQDDFNWLVNDAPATLFGISYNPLNRYKNSKQILTNNQQSQRLRRTCCFYYKAKNPAEYCNNCPLAKKITKSVNAR